MVVALHPEGVDRNNYLYKASDKWCVALHPEGVDRNGISLRPKPAHGVALHPEGVDRNRADVMPHIESHKSPSTRRAWIEIDCHNDHRKARSCRPPPGGRG